MTRLILLLLFLISTGIFVYSLTATSSLAPVPPSARPTPVATSTGAQSIPPTATPSGSWDFVQITSGLASFVTLLGFIGSTWTNWRRGQIRLEQDRIELEKRRLELERLKRDKT
jgi:hypothetical protein